MVDRSCCLKENRGIQTKWGKHTKRHREFNSSDVQEKATTSNQLKSWVRWKHRLWLCEGQKQEANLTGRQGSNHGEATAILSRGMAI